MADGVMVALLPVTDEWSKIELPHMTLVYAGTIGELAASVQNTLAKACSELALLSKPLTLRVMGKEIFGDGSGDNPYVDVFTLRPSPELLAMRSFLEAFNASDFPFTPHVTIGPEGTFIEFQPGYIGFERLLLQWGDEQMVFKLSY
jgi:2'-5' RNA ligase